MISPLAYVDPKAKIGRDVTIHPFAYIDADTEIGDGCEIKPYASILAGTTLGRNVRVYQGAIVGGEPQDFRWKGEPTSVHRRGVFSPREDAYRPRFARGAQVRARQRCDRGRRR